MLITVEANELMNIIEAIKKLPVQGNFDAADRWVGIVIALENLIQAGQQPTEGE